MTAFIILHIFICVFLVCVILLQPGKSDGGIGFGSSSQSIFGSKGAGNFLTKTTSVCALLFLATSFILTRSRIREYSGSVIGKEPVRQEAPATGKSDAKGGGLEGLGDAVKGAKDAPKTGDAKGTPPAKGTVPTKK